MITIMKMVMMMILMMIMMMVVLLVDKKCGKCFHPPVEPNASLAPQHGETSPSADRAGAQ